MCIFGFVSDFGDKDIFVIYGDVGQIFFVVWLVVGGEFGDCVVWCGFGILVVSV